MKKLLFFFVIIAGLMAGAQESSEKYEIHTIKELQKLPEYPGGIANLYKYISENFNPVGSGYLIAGFVIEKDGTVTDVKILRGMNEESDRRLVELIKKCPKWEPGILNGKPVRVRYSLPVKVKFPSTKRIPVDRQ